MPGELDMQLSVAPEPAHQHSAAPQPAPEDEKQLAVVVILIICGFCLVALIFSCCLVFRKSREKVHRVAAAKKVSSLTSNGSYGSTNLYTPRKMPPPSVLSSDKYVQKWKLSVLGQAMLCCSTHISMLCRTLPVLPSGITLPSMTNSKNNSARSLEGGSNKSLRQVSFEDERNGRVCIGARTPGSHRSSTPSGRNISDRIRQTLDIEMGTSSRGLPRPSLAPTASPVQARTPTSGSSTSADRSLGMTPKKRHQSPRPKLSPIKSPSPRPDDVQ
eukprot:scaffold1536_cov397-Prasinococcus_capsulatus_cf.AAC.19